MADTKFLHLFTLCGMLSLSDAGVIGHRNSTDTNYMMKCTEIRPGLQEAFGFHCFTPVGDQGAPNAHWTFNGKPLTQSDKYHMGMRQYESYFNGEMMQVYDMYLVITHVSEEDIGQYDMGVDMGEMHMEQALMLPAALACGNHPLCYEDNCNWPEKLTCRSNPQAYCEMDMCGHNFCMPRWFVGVEEVSCDDVEGIPYPTQ